MDDNGRQPWLLIVIASLGLVLGVIALVVSFNAKSASDDAATQTSVDQVSSELSNLVDRLGIAEASLSGQQKSLQGKANNAVRESHAAVVNLSNRLDRLERKTAALSSKANQTAALSKQVNNLTQQVGALGHGVSTNSAQIKSVNRRVTKLSRQLNSNSGGQAAP